MPPRREHREELALASSFVLHALFLLYLWLHVHPVPLAAPSGGGGVVSFEIAEASPFKAAPIAPAIIKPNLPMLMTPTHGLPKKPRHAANRKVQSEDTVAHDADDEGTIPVIHGIDRSVHHAEQPQVEDDDDDGADSAAAADDRSDDVAEERTSPAGANLQGAGGVGAPGGAMALWGAAIDALAGSNRLVAPRLISQPQIDSGALDRIHARLAARRKACYPRALARVRISGATDVRFCVAPGGMATNIEVLKSSGEPLLDRAATDCVIQGAGALPGEGRCLRVTIDFNAR